MFGSSLPPIDLRGLMSYLRYLCLFAYSGVQHILCCVFVLFAVKVPCYYLATSPLEIAIDLFYLLGVNASFRIAELLVLCSL